MAATEIVLTRPVPAKFKVSSPFGPRKHPVTGEINSFHKGIDFACPVGTPVVACFDGYVASVQKKNEGTEAGKNAGNRIILYTKTHRAFYFHLDDDGFQCIPGQTIKAGELIAFSGATGRITGPHLHFQLEDLKTLQPIEPKFKEEPNESAPT